MSIYSNEYSYINIPYYSLLINGFYSCNHEWTHQNTPNMSGHTKIHPTTKRRDV